MACLDPSTRFQKWILTPEEAIQGAILTITQKQHLQNIMVMAAEERINLSFSPENAQREAELAGHINCIQNILDLSNQAETQLGQKEFHFTDPSDSQ